jgi:excisionase family DNA binding protein
MTLICLVVGAIEVSVPEAANRLGVSTRMLRLYIESRKIQALKVGRKWFIDAASLEAFRQRLHLPATSHQPPALRALQRALPVIDCA